MEFHVGDPGVESKAKAIVAMSNMVTLQSLFMSAERKFLKTAHWTSAGKLVPVREFPRNTHVQLQPDGLPGRTTQVRPVGSRYDVVGYGEEQPCRRGGSERSVAIDLDVAWAETEGLRIVSGV